MIFMDSFQAAALRSEQKKQLHQQKQTATSLWLGRTGLWKAEIPESGTKTMTVT
jgi:hypothetical protein